MARALPWIGHPPTRVRGTIGGSIVNADPSAELPLVAVTLGARIDYAIGDGVEDSIDAADFFFGPMMTALPDAACLTRVHLPIWRGARIGAGFVEVNARRSDFAFAAAAAQVALDEAGQVDRIAVGIGGVGDCPLRLDLDALIGSRITIASLEEAIAAALADVEAMEDLHASAAYRRRAAHVLARRAVEDAVEEAGRVS